MKKSNFLYGLSMLNAFIFNGNSGRRFGFVSLPVACRGALYNAPHYNKQKIKQKEGFMGLKEVYAFLEASDDGKKLLEASKEELEELKDSRAKMRKIETELQKATESINGFAAIKKKMEEAGIDPENPAAAIQKAVEEAAKPAEADKKEAEELRKQLKDVDELRKQLNTVKENLGKEREARKATEQKARVERLRNEFGGALRESMGKYGEILAENLITKGVVKLDDNDLVIYETGDKIYQKDAAIEVLKAEHKDFIVAKPGGSNLPPPPPSNSGNTGGGNSNLGGKTGEEIGKMSASQWFSMGLAQNSGA